MEKKYRLRSNRDYRPVYDQGKSKANRHLVIFYKENGLEYSRIGYTATKKLGKAVVRNRTRRLMKESFRHLSSEVKPGYDIIILARASATQIDYKTMMSAVAHGLKITNLRKEVRKNEKNRDLAD